MSTIITAVCIVVSLALVVYLHFTTDDTGNDYQMKAQK